MLALPRAFREFLFVMKEGFSESAALAPDKLDVGALRPEMPGGWKNPWNFVSRALSAADVFYRSVAREGEMYRAAYDVAKKGTEGTLQERMAKALNELPEKTIREIENVVDRAVMQEPSGPITQAILNLRSKIHGSWLLMPFVRIAANISRQGMEATPVGFAMKAARTPGRVGEQARDRALLGTLTLAPIVYWAVMGKISGAGPSDPREQAAKRATGWRPNSIKMGDEWVSYGSWQPLALPMSLVANAVESYQGNVTRRAKEEQKDPMDIVAGDPAVLSEWTQALSEIAFRTANSVMSQSFLSGLSDLHEALSDPERKAMRAVGRVGQSMVPMSGALRTVTQAMDPTQRRPKTIQEYLSAILPGRSGESQPAIDVYGQPVQQVGHALTRGFYAGSPELDDPVSIALREAGVTPSLPNGLLMSGNQKILLQPAEETALAMARGQMGRLAYESVLASVGEAWSQMPAESKQIVLRNAAREMREVVSFRAKAMKTAGQALTVEALMAGFKPLTGERKLAEGKKPSVEYQRKDLLPGLVTLYEKQAKEATSDELIRTVEMAFLGEGLGRDVPPLREVEINEKTKASDLDIPSLPPSPFDLGTVVTGEGNYEALRTLRGSFPRMPASPKITSLPFKELIEDLAKAGIPLERHGETNLSGARQTKTGEIYISPNVEKIATLAHEKAHAAGLGEFDAYRVGVYVEELLRRGVIKPKRAKDAK
jgi:hypothetical protein